MRESTAHCDCSLCHIPLVPALANLLPQPPFYIRSLVLCPASCSFVSTQSSLFAQCICARVCCSFYPSSVLAFLSLDHVHSVDPISAYGTHRICLSFPVHDHLISACMLHAAATPPCSHRAMPSRLLHVVSCGVVSCRAPCGAAHRVCVHHIALCRVVLASCHACCACHVIPRTSCVFHRVSVVSASCSMSGRHRAGYRGALCCVMSCSYLCSCSSRTVLSCAHPICRTCVPRCFV